ncbi:MAG: putative selenium-dependent hydroxylase accessory protein YqeC [Dorea sp.]|nr:putative selenium-dependent hydroxylase accessory protein YqeC [Dorea sp.]
MERLMELLKIDASRHRLLAFVGAGGKTTLIYELAMELGSMGYSVAVTTTTHMGADGRYGFTPIGIPCGEGKIKGISPAAPYKLLGEYDFVLTEADGSRQLPFKVPESHEPVLPENVNLVVGMAGAAAVGRTFESMCCRYPLACRCFFCRPDDRIELTHLAESLTASWGQKKNVTCDYRYVIGQGDLLDEKQKEYIRDLAGRMGEGCILSFQKSGKYRI